MIELKFIWRRSAGWAIVSKLDSCVGPGDHGKPLLNCPVCGPAIAVPRIKKDGDIIPCNACRGKFELHIKEDTFDVAFKNERVFTLQPEIDTVQIEEIAREAPCTT